MLTFSKILYLLRDIVVFIVIFSFINDNFLVDHFGVNILKAILGLFIAANFYTMYSSLTDRQVLRYLLPFLLFYIANYFVMLLNPPSTEWSKLFESAMLMAAILLIVLFFIRYDLIRALWFTWSAMVFSAVLSFFNQPITQWTFRKTGGTGDPNEFASQMIALLFISVYLFTTSRDIKVKALLMTISVPAFVYAILHAASMSSFLVLGAMSLIVVYRLFSLNFMKSAVTMLAAVLIIVISVTAFSDKLMNIEITSKVLGRTKETGTASFRMNSWKAGVNMFIDKPVFGVGVNAYSQFTRQYSKIYISEDALAPHNIYIKLLAESGIVVFSLFMVFLFDLMIRHFRRIFYSEHFWLYMVLVGYLLMGLTLGLTYNKYLWLSIAMLMNLHQLLRQENSSVYDYMLSI